MASDETKVVVRLETSKAKAELDSVVDKGREAARKMSGLYHSTVGRGLSAVGLGGGIGMGFAAVRSATESGFSDVIGEALGGVGAQLEHFFLGNLGEDAKASRAAREDTIQAFGAIAGAQNKIPPSAHAFFNSVKSIRMQEEHGRALFERDDKMRGPGIEELITKIMSAIGELVSKAVDSLAEKLNPFK
jgi:hypothetical protein